jgi:hypothetical protein
MNSFESMVAMIFDREGYWVKPNFKVDLTKEEKRAIGRPSSPRWELDLVAYKASGNELLAIECKSYLDSPGVRASGFIGDNSTEKARYKLFNEDRLRQVVLNRLCLQLLDLGLVPSLPKVRLCLAAGKLASEADREAVNDHFESHDWLLFDDGWLRNRLLQISQSGYEDEIASIVAKLLLRY